MVKIILRKEDRPPHNCYRELYSAQYNAQPTLGYGSVLECSCGKWYRLVNFGMLGSLWNSLTGRDHVTFGGDVWDQWNRVHRDEDRS